MSRGLRDWEPMAGYDCEEHGPQIALPFCRHAAEAAQERRPFDVFLQFDDEVGWYTLCTECAKRPGSDEVFDLVELLCCRCVVEWARATGSDYVERANSPAVEFPAA